LADLSKDLRNRMDAPLDFVGVAVDENRDNLLVSRDEALQSVLSQVDSFIGLDNVVVAVDEFGNQLECSGPLIDFGEQGLPSRVDRINPDDLIIYSDPIDTSVRYFETAFRHVADVYFSFQVLLCIHIF
jgi:hypothetical protein